MQALTLKTNTQPTFMNRALALGVLGGLQAGRIAGVIAAGSAGAMLGGGIGMLTIGVMSGLAGKASMEKALRDGKPVEKPSFWNNDIALGGLMGLTVAQAINGLVLSAGPMVGVGMALLGVLSAATFAVVGGYLGGQSGKARMAREYEEAQQQAGQTISPARSPDQTPALAMAKSHVKRRPGPPAG